MLCARNIVTERQCVSAAPSTHHAKRCYRMEFSSDSLRMLTGLCFFALAIVVATYGMKVGYVCVASRCYTDNIPRAHG